MIAHELGKRRGSAPVVSFTTSVRITTMSRELTPSWRGPGATSNVHAAVVHCIEAHHEEVEPSTVEAIIVIVADALSGSRTGARRESLELYLKRLEALEAVANVMPGVEKSFAIQAGREIRVIVKPEEIDDLGASRMAKEISRRIQESLDYPGQVKVTVIRERRSIEYAK
jgi:ribonuclease Y